MNTTGKEGDVRISFSNQVTQEGRKGCLVTHEPASDETGAKRIDESFKGLPDARVMSWYKKNSRLVPPLLQTGMNVFDAKIFGCGKKGNKKYFHWMPVILLLPQMVFAGTIFVEGASLTAGRLAMTLFFKDISNFPENKFFIALLETISVYIVFLVPVQNSCNAMGEHAQLGQYSVNPDVDEKSVEPLW